MQHQFRFDGDDYVPERDNKRLSNQLFRIWDCMKDGNWRTLKEISIVTESPEASVSAQLRHLRKERFGSHAVERDHIRNGLYKYRLVINKETALRKKL